MVGERLRAADAGRPWADGPVFRGYSLLVFAVVRASRGGRGRASVRLARVAHFPDRAAGVVSDEERPVLGDGERGRPSPYFSAPFARRPEAGHEILVVARRLPVLERHAHHLIAGRPDPHEEGPGLGINGEVPIRVPGGHTEDALLGEKLGPIGAGGGLAVLRWHLLGP